MRVRGALLIAVTVAALLTSVAGPVAAQEVRPYLPVLWAYPEAVRQGGEFVVEYNLSKSVLIGGGTLRSTNTMKSAEVSLMIPLNMPYNITRVAVLDPDFNPITNATVEGSTIRVSAQKIGVISVRARVIVPLSVAPGDYTIYVRAKAEEEIPNGTIIDVDHSRSVKVSVVSWAPRVTLEVQPREIEPPGTLTVRLTIANVEDAWILDPETGLLSRRGLRLTGCNLTIRSTLLEEPIVESVGSVGPSEVKLVSRSFMIGSDIQAGRHTLILILRYSYDGSSSAAALTKEVRVVKNAQLSIQPVGDGLEAVSGGQLNLTLRVSNDSPWNVSSVSLSVALGDQRREVEIGPLRSYEARVVSVIMQAPEPGNYTARATATWVNPYPAVEMNSTVEVPVRVNPSAGVSARLVVAAALAVGVAAAAVRLIGSKKAGEH